MIKLFVPCLSSLLMLVACGDSSEPNIESITINEPNTNATQNKLPIVKIALVIKSFTNPFFIEMAKGARIAQKETGIDLRILATTPETSVEQQIRIVDGQIKAHVDAIVISPVNIQRLQPVLKKAQDAGIVIVNIDERLDSHSIAALSMKSVPFVGVDNERAAYKVATYISDQIKTPTQAAIFVGIPGSNTSIDRQRGAQRAFNDNKKLQIVAIGAANWKSEDAYDLAKQIFKSYPKIGVVFCSNDLMAIGLMRYLQESGRNKVVVGGFDALTETKRSIQNGEMMATIDQQASRQGYLGITHALKLLRHETLPNTVLVETVLVTSNTLN